MFRPTPFIVLINEVENTTVRKGFWHILKLVWIILETVDLWRCFGPLCRKYHMLTTGEQRQKKKKNTDKLYNTVCTNFLFYL